MRVQCDVCEKAVASIMCCADEAALCTDCDTRVHAANKLANKHQRVALIKAVGDPTRCDICQEKSAFFFCLEDRALLCRDCDVSIHSATALSAAHQRFLVPGTKVALEALSNNNDASEIPAVEDFPRHPLSSIINAPSMITSPVSMNSSSISTKSSFSSPLNSRSAPTPAPAPTPTPAPAPTPVANGKFSFPENAVVVFPSATHSSHGSGGGGGGGNDAHNVSSTLVRRPSIPEFLSEAIPSWRVDELLNIPELADGYSLGDVASSKADVANLGDYDWTADLSLFDEQVYAESFHEVPQMTATPTTSGVTSGRAGRGPGSMKGKAKQDSIVPDYDDAFVVPDLGLHCAPASPPVAKRRRQFVGI